MSETVKQQETATINNEQGAASEKPERTFTQAELDAIVQDRLKRDRQKYADYEDVKAKAAKFDELEEAAKSDLQKATERADALQAKLDAMQEAETQRLMRADVAKEVGVPAELLTGATAEDCREQAKAIMAFKSQKGYPVVKDSGEVANTGKMTTRQQFAQWMDALPN